MRVRHDKTIVAGNHDGASLTDVFSLRSGLQLDQGAAKHLFSTLLCSMLEFAGGPLPGMRVSSLTRMTHLFPSVVNQGLPDVTF